MTTHDFRPGDVVSWAATNGAPCQGRIEYATVSHALIADVSEAVPLFWLTLVSRPASDPAPAPTEHPSRSRAASSLRAASASLATAIDHLTRAGEAETYPGQTVIRTRTAAEETQACIHHATMALYWMLHERLS